MRIIVSLLLAATAIAGCKGNKDDDTEPPCPEVDEVTLEDGTPATVPNNGNALLSVTGSGFEVYMNTPRTRPVLSPWFELEGDSATLTLIAEWVDRDRVDLALNAQNPPLAAGLYDLVVTNPSGCATVFEDAVELTEPNGLDPNIVIEQVIPPFGWTESPTAVTVIGSGFVSTPRAYIATALDLFEYELEQVAFIDGGSLSAIVPAGLPVGGPYALTVENPGGGYNQLFDAFTVTADAPPNILTVIPEVGTTQDDTDVVISGLNFDSAPEVVVVDIDGNTTPVAVNGATPTEILATIPSSNLGVAAYLVRVQNTDGSWDDHSAFVVHNPSAKLGTSGPWEMSQPMARGRRGHGLLSWVDSLGRAFLFAVGGDDGTDPLDSAERSAADAFGRLGPWQEVPTTLNSPRADAVYALLDGYIYAIGGHDGNGPLDTVERASVLVDGAGVHPDITDATVVEATGTLAAGTWYYRVSALLDGADPFNPNGETLASAVEVVAVATDDSSVELTWTAVPNAAAYNVYRTDVVNDAAGREHLISADVGGTTFADDGLAPGAIPFVPEGSIGEWTVLSGLLPSPRSNGAITIGRDSLGDTYVYVLGGHDGVGADDEVFVMAADETWSVAGAMIVGRMDNAASIAGYDQAQIMGANTPTYVIAMQGDDGSGVTNHAEFAEILDGGGLSAFAELSRLDSNGQKRLDGRGVAAADHVYFLGGAGSAGGSPESSGRQAEIQGPVLDLGSWSSTSASGTLQVPRADFGLIQLRAGLYAAGGRTDTEAATTSVEQAVF